MERRERIFNALFDAAEKGFTALFSQHNEHFYYCALIMMETATPCIAAISEESLERVLNNYYSDELARNENREYYKWSYADSPYIGYGYEDYFKEVEELFKNYVWKYYTDETEFIKRANEWLEIMAEVMLELDRKGVFNTNVDRSKLFINAETQPPEDNSINILNARKLNNESLFTYWYEDNRKEYEFEE